MQICKMLMKKQLYVDNDQLETALVSSVKSGNCTILHLILDGCNSHLSFNIPILHLACKLNNGRRIVKLQSTNASAATDEDHITAYLVENLNLNIVSNYNNEGYTPILLAAHFRFLSCVKYLVSTSKNVEEQSEEYTKDCQHNILDVCAQQEGQHAMEKSTSSNHLAMCMFLFEDQKYKYITFR
jgi:hypothetical protein